MNDDPQYASHDGSALRIWTDTAQNAFISEQEGRPIFDEVIYVEVISPGSRGSQPVFEVKRTFSKEGAVHYKKTSQLGPKYAEYKEYITKFEADDAGIGTHAGTPLRSWPEISRSMAASLNEARIYTVEALANLPDTALNMVGPDGRTWREKAKAFLELAGDSSAATALAAENSRLAQELADSRAETKALGDRMAALEAAAASGGTPTPPAPEQAPTVAPNEPVTPSGAKPAKPAKGGLADII